MFCQSDIWKIIFAVTRKFTNGYVLSQRPSKTEMAWNARRSLENTFYPGQAYNWEKWGTLLGKGPKLLQALDENIQEVSCIVIFAGWEPIFSIWNKKRTFQCRTLLYGRYYCDPNDSVRNFREISSKFPKYSNI